MPGDRTPDNRRANAHFGRIDPFCLLPVGALLLAGAVFILNQAALEGVILVVIAALIVVFDSWVNRPREFEQRTAGRRRPANSTGPQSRAFTPPPRNQRPQDRTGGQNRTRMQGGQNRGQGGGQNRQQPPAWQNQPRRQGQPGGQPGGAMGAPGGRGGGPVRRGPGQPPNERPPFERSGNSAR